MPFLRSPDASRPAEALDHETHWINCMALLDGADVETCVAVLVAVSDWVRQHRDDELASLRFHQRTVQRAMALEFEET